MTEDMPASIDEHLAQIGRIAVVWSGLELQLKYALGVMIGVDPARVMPLVAELPASHVLERTTVIATAALGADEAAEMKALCDDLDKLRVRRNQAVHSTWLMTVGEAGVRRLTMTGRKGYELRADPVRIDDLRALGSELEEATRRTERTLTRLLGREALVHLADIAGME